MSETSSFARTDPNRLEIPSISTTGVPATFVVVARFSAPATAFEGVVGEPPFATGIAKAGEGTACRAPTSRRALLFSRLMPHNLIITVSPLLFPMGDRGLN